MRKIVLTFGLMAGGVMSAMMVLALAFQDAIGFDKGVIVGYTSMVVAFLMVYFGVRSYRDNVAEGTISMGQAFKVGLLITLVASCCYVATWEVIYYNFLPDFMEKYSAYEIQKARDAGASAAQLAEMTKGFAVGAERYRNPLWNIAYTIIEPLPVGLLFTVVTAFTLGRKRRQPEVTAA